jgi:hypothetical protein
MGSETVRSGALNYPAARSCQTSRLPRPTFCSETHLFIRSEFSVSSKFHHLKICLLNERMIPPWVSCFLRKHHLLLPSLSLPFRSAILVLLRFYFCYTTIVPYGLVQTDSVHLRRALHCLCCRTRGKSGKRESFCFRASGERSLRTLCNGETGPCSAPTWNIDCE